MAFKTFAPGVLTSSDVNTFLMQQAVITCTSSTRPSSPIEGMTIYETDTDLLLTYTGSAWEQITAVSGWQTWTPTWTTSGGGTWAPGNATVNARYRRMGRMVVCSISILMGSTTTYGSGGFVGFTLPVNTVGTSAYLETHPIGVCYLHDDSIGSQFTGYVTTSGAFPGSVLPRCHTQSGAVTHITDAGVTNTVPFSWTTSDEIKMFFTYEAAS